MSALLATAHLDVSESLRARWFLVYSLVFGGAVALLFALGLTESRVLGLIGLSRFLATYIQLCMAILPIFVLLTTVRSVAGDREAGINEYLLALPIPLWAWYWGKLLGRFAVVFLPVFLAMAAAAGWASWSEAHVPWRLFAIYSGLLAGLIWCFLGLGMLISTLARSVDVAQGAAFVLWLGLLLFLDLILLGLLIQGGIEADTAIGLALANPLQVFRTGAMMLFDPELIVLGPTAFVIFDTFGHEAYLAWAALYPVTLGSLAAIAGFLAFRRGDLP
ncbi:MAG: ABC transporter permease subunit [bacterium]|nr:ABC transporter permease subunit [bacterium]